MTAKHFRSGDAMGPHYRCSKCNLYGYRLWRDTNVFLNHIDLLCAACAEVQEKEVIERYAHWHESYDPSIGNLVPARPTPEGDTFWGHTSGDVEWWYALPMYVDPARELKQVTLERDHFVKREQGALRDWLEAREELARFKRLYANDVAIANQKKVEQL